MDTNINNLSEDLKEVLKVTQERTKEDGGSSISISHIISSVVNLYLKDRKGNNSTFRDFVTSMKTEKVNNILDSFEIFSKKIKILYRKEVTSFSWNRYYLPLTEGSELMLRSDGSKDILRFLFEIKMKSENPSTSDKFSGDEIDAIHLLIGFGFYKELRDFVFANYDGTDVIKEKRIMPEDYSKDDDYDDISQNSPFDGGDIEKEFEMAGDSSDSSTINSDPNSKTPFLDKYSVNFTEQAKNGKFDPVIGRDNEISQIIEILGCRKKKNCILTGLPGIGKTSIVQELSRRIVEGNVPRELIGKQIRSLDLTSLVSGAIYRGQSEERVMGVCKEASENPDIILYIDEIHNIIGNGSSTGTGGTDEIMKPYLSNNDGITVIGSTTDEEYRKFIEKNGAFKRRFQEVSIVEPGIEETINILTNLIPKYEEFHKVKYTKEVIEACVIWSNQYINDRFFPDKAVDLMDISGSLTKFEKKIDTSKIKNLEKSIETVQEEKNRFLRELELTKAQERRNAEILLRNELENEKKIYEDNINNPDNWPEVTIDKVANIVSKLSRVPVDKIRQTSLSKLKSMKKSMESTIIGQDNAIKEITMSLNRQFLGIKDPEKPASFLMVGPTGTGKTYCAKQVAEQIFGGDKSLIRIDCSEYIEKYSVSKLLGSTAGYVGYEDEPILLKVKRRPFSVVLFDEIEKMSEEIINTVFLPILDEGYITLANGTKVSFRNSIIIMTSNIGVKELSNKVSLGFSKLSESESREEDKDIVMKAIKKKFRPEVINRFGNIIFFQALGEDELKKIFDLEIDKLKKRLSKKGIELEVSEGMRDFIVSKCDRAYGARDLQRGIIKYIEDSICEKMISTANPDNCGSFIKVVIKDGIPDVSFKSSFDVKIGTKKPELVTIS